jgi:hypothetical protein
MAQRHRSSYLELQANVRDVPLHLEGQIPFQAESALERHRLQYPGDDRQCNCLVPVEKTARIFDEIDMKLTKITSAGLTIKTEKTRLYRQTLISSLFNYFDVVDLILL